MRPLPAFLLLISSAAAQEIHCKHFFGGMPTGTPETNDLVFRDLYVLSSNDETKFADWVAYRITPEETFGTLDLERKWRSEPFLDEDETLEATPDSKDDYRGRTRSSRLRPRALCAARVVQGFAVRLAGEPRQQHRPAEAPDECRPVRVGVHSIRSGENGY